MPELSKTLAQVISPALYQIIRPFIDPVTFDKISFDAADVLKLCPADQIDASFNGTNGFEWASAGDIEQLFEQRSRSAARTPAIGTSWSPNATSGVKKSSRAGNEPVPRLASPNGTLRRQPRPKSRLEATRRRSRQRRRLQKSQRWASQRRRDP